MEARAHAAFMVATVIIKVLTSVQFVIFILTTTRKMSRGAAFPLTAFRTGLLPASSPGAELGQLSWLAPAHRSL